jgi:hypothetical protein
MSDLKQIEPMVEPRQMAIILGVHVRQVQRLCATGKLPAKNIGTGARYKKWRVRLSDFKSYMAGADNGAVAAPEKPMDLPPGVRDMGL